MLGRDGEEPLSPVWGHTRVMVATLKITAICNKGRGFGSQVLRPNTREAELFWGICEVMQGSKKRQVYEAEHVFF
jgi:hypothetical protein